MAIDINASDWDEKVVNANKPVIVDFWHEQCVWCQRLNPVYEELSKEYDEASFLKLNGRAAPENMELAQKLGIMGTPTMKVFCQGREVGEIVGFRDKNNLKSEIENVLNESKECLTQSTKI